MATTPALAETKEKEKDKDKGYYLTEKEMVELAQKIKKLQEENIKLKQILKEERQSYDKVIDQANRTIDVQDNQIKDLKDLNKDYEKEINDPDIVQKLLYILAGIGAGNLLGR
ncbi:hypothetical protein [Orenia marismortui]|uniref:Uncharacterized protein n=1 Tax=Orenia marismortui TaxID=46469 RepID=A0A4R8GLP5_9FIRM|nr:hypothetical protein [Orenia marismortui]TDX46596.1 hypothetical protein C7959_13911 [Orenia marismortui]